MKNEIEDKTTSVGLREFLSRASQTEATVLSNHAELFDMLSTIDQNFRTLLRTVKTFGYSSRNNLWVRIMELEDRRWAIMAENALDAKAEIAAWSR